MGVCAVIDCKNNQNQKDISFFRFPDKEKDSKRHKIWVDRCEIMSPILFSLFVNDLDQELTNNTSNSDLLTNILLFADDMVILGSSPIDLQDKLNNLNNYCLKWGLTVNIAKTKIMVFRKRGKTHLSEKWKYYGHKLDVVDDFNYLGTVFNYTGNFSKNQEHLAGKALKACDILLYKCRELNLKPKLLCDEPTRRDCY